MSPEAAYDANEPDTVELIRDELVRILASFAGGYDASRTLARWCPENDLEVLEQLREWQPRREFIVDVYERGATVYRLWKGEIIEIVGWAQNMGVASETFDRIVSREPNNQFILRARGHVMRKHNVG